MKLRQERVREIRVEIRGASLILLILFAGSLAAFQSARAQRLASAQDAERSVRSFVGRPAGPLVTKSRIWLTRHGIRRGVQTPSDARRRADEQHWERYEIDALTGEVTAYELWGPRPPARKPEERLSGEQCAQIATDFVAPRYAGFAQARWFRQDFPAGDGVEWHIQWKQILNRFGTLAPSHIYVRMDTSTGEILRYSGWHPVITGPTVPRISRDQALAIAARLARWDPREVPFDPVTLEMVTDEIGVQRLTWDIWQRLRNAEGRDLGGWSVVIDAITDEVSGTAASLGGVPGRPLRSNGNVRRRPPPAVWLRGRPLDLALGMVLERGRAFVPVGVAQLFGWRLEEAPGRSATLVNLEDARHVRVGPGSRSELPARRVRGRLFVPVRALAKLAGVPVTWEKEHRRVHFAKPASASPVRGTPAQPVPGYPGGARAGPFGGRTVPPADR